MTKTQKRTGAAVLIVLVVHAVLCFAIPFYRNSVFWISYFFALIAIVGQLYVLKIAFVNGERQKSKWYGIPVLWVGIAYMTVQIVLSFLFMSLSTVVPVGVVTVFSVVPLATALLGLLSTTAVRDEILHQEEERNLAVSYMQKLRAVVEPLVAQCQDAATAKALQHLADDLHYSDPVSSPELAGIEAELWSAAAELQRAVPEENLQKISKLCQNTENILIERNRLCKRYKK